jgi:hypothetical protein
VDTAQATINSSVAGERRASLLLLLTHEIANAGTVRLRCASDGIDQEAAVQYVRIQAMRVGQVQRLDLADHSSQTLGTGSPLVIDVRRDGPLTSTSPADLLGAVPLSAGSWSIMAKLIGSASSASTLECRLEGGGVSDDQYADLPAAAIDTEALGLVPHIAQGSPSPQVNLTCLRSPGANVRLRAIHFLALKVGTLIQPSQATLGSGKPVVVAGHYDDQLLSGGGVVTTFATLHVSQGSWAVVAKLEAFVAHGIIAFVDCQLSAGGEIDESTVKMGNVTDYASMSFSLTHAFIGVNGGNVILRCSDAGLAKNQSHLAWVNIMAVQAGSLG